jgi:hypothetical protein
MAEKEYRRLTRTRQRTAFGIVATGRCSLWLGMDHILSIETTGYTESYKRFYFRDIQAITLRQTDRWKYWNLVLGAITGLFGLIAVGWGRSEVVAAWVFGILTALIGLWLAINAALGPTCVTHLQTAVQTEPLPSLSRLRKGRKVLARLRPLLTEAQGPLAPEEIPARVQELIGVAPSANPAPAASPPFAAEDPNAPPRSAA